MNITKKLSIIIGCILYIQYVSAQAPVYKTFKDTRVINAMSTETLKAGKLDFRVGHRFGDLSGDRGGWPTFYGLESAADVLIGFEYGLTDKLMVGINRAKGAGPLKQNVNALFKYKFVNQEKGGNQPLSIACYGMSSTSTMPKSNSDGVLNAFIKPEHRWSYHFDLIIARKFSEYFSLQLNGGVTHRNLVNFNDQNTMGSIAAAARVQVTKSLGVLLEGRHIFSNYKTTADGFYTPIGVALEWETGGGHVFQMNFTNAEGMADTDYIPYTTSNWLDGGFRLGFTISRQFSL